MYFKLSTCRLSWASPVEEEAGGCWLDLEVDLDMNLCAQCISYPCACNKPSYHCLYSPVQPLPIPECPWHSISMDFVYQLLLSSTIIGCRMIAKVTLICTPVLVLWNFMNND